MEHRGMTHSIIFFVTFLPIFLLYGKRVLPYFSALVQHVIVGDYITSQGIQFFWPFDHTMYGLRIAMASPTNILLEWILFLASIALMFREHDIRVLLESRLSNLLLLVPLIALLPPAILASLWDPLNTPTTTFGILVTLHLLDSPQPEIRSGEGEEVTIQIPSRDPEAVDFCRIQEKKCRFGAFYSNTIEISLFENLVLAVKR